MLFFENGQVMEGKKTAEATTTRLENNHLTLNLYHSDLVFYEIFERNYKT